MNQRKRLEVALTALDIETLRPYHVSSFQDPPSYHEAGVATLWDCPMCVEQHMRRSLDTLAVLRGDLLASSKGGL